MEKKHATQNGTKSQQRNGHSIGTNGRPAATGGWKVKASDGAMNTSNPIREIIETMNLAENPNKKVIPLSIGDPTIFGNLKPCPEILEAIQRANQSGKYYGYQTAAGLESAREAVASYHFKCTGNKVKPQDVILASGCSHAIDLCICVLARGGQNILIPRPGFPLYKTLTSVYGVKYKQYDLLADRNWSVDLGHLESLIDENTAAIVVNNPSNPCGSVFSKEHLLEILELAERHRLPIIADEIYDKFVFSPEFYPKRAESRASSLTIEAGRTCLSLDLTGRPKRTNQRSNNENKQPKRSEVGGFVDESAQKSSKTRNGLHVDDDDEQVTYSSEDESATGQQFQYVPFTSMAELSETVPILTCGGISKTCLIPGLRLGWIIINDRKNVFDITIRQGLGRLTQRLMGPNSLIQGALQDILNNVPDRFYKQTMDFIFKNAKKCHQRLQLVRGLRPYMPQGSMYLMVKFDAKLFPDIRGDLDFTSKLMNEESVLVLPGSCFDFPNFFRICLTVPSNVMEEALDRIEEFCRRNACIEFESNTFKNQIKEKRTTDATVDAAAVDQLQLPLIQPVNTKSKSRHSAKHNIATTPNIDQKISCELTRPYWPTPNNEIGSQKT